MPRVTVHCGLTGSGGPPCVSTVDTEKPAAAPIYDWYLGGDQNWAVDREFGRRAEKLWPLIKPIARQNRAWMNRLVEAALGAGIRQFIDLGSGAPTDGGGGGVGNVHKLTSSAP
jgi:hypothetical protein